jgi:putative transposase
MAWELRRKTCQRFNEQWHAHSLTFSCFHGLALFESDETKWLMVRALDRARVSQEFDLWAYVIVPTHVHVLVFPRRDEYSIASILAAIKRPVSYHGGKAGRQDREHFWQPGGGYDRNLWKAETIHREIEYLHNNPVRKGLCERAEDWVFSSAGFWSGKRDVPLKMDDTLPPRECV